LSALPPLERDGGVRTGESSSVVRGVLEKVFDNADAVIDGNWLGLKSHYPRRRKFKGMQGIAISSPSSA
jgi:hypothetical protein